MDPVAHALVIAVCLLLSAFFSSSETALLRLRDDEVERDVQAAHGPAVLAAQRLLRSTSRLLVTILLGNNVVNILAASVSSALAIHYLGERVGIAASTLALTLTVLIFCEVMPKALAARNPRGVSYALALPLYLLHQLLRPVHLLFDRVVDPFVEAVTGGHGHEDDGSAYSEEVLRMARRLRQGQPDGSALAIIRAAADAADTTVETVMVPATEIVAFDEGTAPEELLEKMLASRFTRVPIQRETVDDIVGNVHLKDVIRLVRAGRSDLSAAIRPVLRVPPRKPILDLLSDMQRAFIHCAMVKDEFGRTLGLLTQEDVLEELVGEIRDEFDREELLTVRRVSDSSYRALGRVKVADFNRETGWEVPAEPGDSLSGLLFNALGHPPREGDTADFPGYQLEVISVSGTRVTEIGVEKVEVEA